jgi:hypothetical protein
VDEVLDDAGAGELLQMEARLADLDPFTFDVADPEPLADQVVDPHTAHHDLSPGLRARQADVLQSFGLDESQSLTGARPVGEKVAVALQAMAGDGTDGIDRAQRLTGTDVDGLDVHAIHHPGWPASPPTG